MHTLLDGQTQIIVSEQELLFFIELWQAKNQARKNGLDIENPRNIDLSAIVLGECVTNSESVYEQVSYIRTKYLDMNAPFRIEVDEEARKQVQYVLHNVFRKRMKAIYKQTTMLYHRRPVESDLPTSRCPCWTNCCASRQSCSWLCDDDQNLDEMDRNHSPRRRRKMGWKRKKPETELEIQVDETLEEKDALLSIFSKCENDVWQTLLEEFQLFQTTAEFYRIFKRMIRDGHFVDDELKGGPPDLATQMITTQSLT